MWACPPRCLKEEREENVSLVPQISGRSEEGRESEAYARQPTDLKPNSHHPMRLVARPQALNHPSNLRVDTRLLVVRDRRNRRVVRDGDDLSRPVFYEKALGQFLRERRTEGQWGGTHEYMSSSRHTGSSASLLRDAIDELNLSLSGRSDQRSLGQRHVDLLADGRDQVLGHFRVGQADCETAIKSNKSGLRRKGEERRGYRKGTDTSIRPS